MNIKIDLRTANEVVFDEEFMETLQNLTSNNLTDVTVKNKHEAYGIASQHISELTRYCKGTKSDLTGLLQLLPLEECSPMQVIDSLNTIYSTCVLISKKAMITAAIMQHMIQDFYTQAQEYEKLPLEELSEESDFESVEDKEIEK